MSDHTTTTLVTTNGELSSLADLANSEHAASFRSAGETLGHVLACGAALNAAKALCVHGGWEHWLDKNFEGSLATARAYRRLDKHRELIADITKTLGPGVLTLEGAIRLIQGHQSLLGGPPRKPAPATPAMPDQDIAFDLETIEGIETAPVKPIRSGTPVISQEDRTKFQKGIGWVIKGLSAFGIYDEFAESLNQMLRRVKEL